MNQNFAEALQFVLKSEGGFVDNPKDPGGMTNLGVTKATWEEWVGYPVTEKTMRALTPADVAPMYRRKYWDKTNADDLPSGIDYCVMDTAINSGPGRAIKFLQGCLGLDMDGIIGPATLKAVGSVDCKEFISDYAKRRLSYLQDLPTWEFFGRGWTKRVQDMQENALSFLG